MSLEHGQALLERAEAFYDRSPALQLAARAAALDGFAGGARWMSLAIEELRGRAAPPREARWWAWGTFKYGLCAAACAPVLWICWGTGQWGWSALCAVAFYALEAQMVFLFPALLDGSARPLSASRLWTRRAGGTVEVMTTVWRLAWTMILGGIAGRGAIRSWCLGCLAVAIWYEDLQRSARRMSRPIPGPL